jgi:hypothetical protein
MRRLLMTATILVLIVSGCGDDEADPAGTIVRATSVPTTVAVTTIAMTTTTPTATTTVVTTTTTMPVPDPFDEIQVSFEIEMDTTTNVTPGIFIATGPAVDTGLMCPTGTTFENDYEDLGGGHEGWETRFKCEDGTGSFSIWFDAVGGWTDGAGSTWASTGTWEWMTEKGTAAYVGIEGSGDDASECSIEQGACFEEFSGSITRTA